MPTLRGQQRELHEAIGGTKTMTEISPATGSWIPRIRTGGAYTISYNTAPKCVTFQPIIRSEWRNRKQLERVGNTKQRSALRRLAGASRYHINCTLPTPRMAACNLIRSAVQSRSHVRGRPLELDLCCCGTRHHQVGARLHRRCRWIT